MTKKDYIKAAELVVREFGAHTSLSNQLDAAGGPDGVEVRQAVVELLAEIFSADNPRFDADRFRSACRGETAKSKKG